MINQKYIKLEDYNEFDRRVMEHKNSCGTFIQAYKLTERDYQSVPGRKKPKYSSFESWYISFNRRQKKLLKI